MNLFGWGLRARWERAARSAKPGTALHRYLSERPPTRATPSDEVPLLAVDLETTGLDPKTDYILAVGFVPVDGAAIRLDGAREYVVKVPREVGQSATVHGITDDEMQARGWPLAHVLEEVLTALTGRVLLAHYSTIEEEFLSRACRSVYGAAMPARVVDTLELERRLTTNEYDDPRKGTLRLGNARDRHHLPRYRGHAALSDALACAELYLAQRAVFAERGQRTLGALSS
ncbi:MAG: exonuclease domain-containing protein [Mobilicoccus sp.]|nr:exonuclease domain-containing protein [Mobilicoccus sp.]